MFNESSTFVRIFGYAIILSLLIVSLIYSTTLFYEADKSEFIELAGAPRILSPTTMEDQHAFKPGDGVVIHYEMIKHEIGCWAEYQNTIVNSVNAISYQFPIRRSRFIGPRGTTSRNTANLLVELPQTLPKGVYQVQMTVFPVCDGIPRDAFKLSNPTPTLAVE